MPIRRSPRRSVGFAAAFAVAFGGVLLAPGCASSKTQPPGAGDAVSSWFDDSVPVACDLATVAASVDDIGDYFLQTTRHMPGLSRVDLVEQGEGVVIIETNEGTMRRTNVVTTVSEEAVTIEYDEEYEAGSAINATCHVRNTFTPTDAGVTHHMVISNLEAPGFLGFFYRNLGSKNIGTALLASQRTHLEAQ